MKTSWNIVNVILINIAARLSFHQPRDCSITEFLKYLHWLIIEDRIAFKIFCVTWQSLNGKDPSYISSLISPYNPKMPLRSSSNRDLCVPKSRTSYGDCAFWHFPPFLWNSLPGRPRSRFSKTNLRPIFLENRTVNRIYFYTYCSA